jgi:hypothetical protein
MQRLYFIRYTSSCFRVLIATLRSFEGPNGSSNALVIIKGAAAATIPHLFASIFKNLLTFLGETRYFSNDFLTA